MSNTPRAAGNALHTPVLVGECIRILAPAFGSYTDPVLIDCTLGMGGHSEAFLRKFPHLRVIGIDRDAEAIALAQERLVPFEDRFTAVRTTYDRVDDVAATAPGTVAGILMDLGVSSLQLDETDRGFSYAKDAPLDMRMDVSAGQSAAELLATASADELQRILVTYGEERFARRIVHAIVERRAHYPITHTAELVDIVRDSIPAPARRTGGNPAKRTFQALRIAVNNELTVLEDALPRAIDALAVGGRIVVEAYQSLEDRIVKREFAQGARSHTPEGLPVELPGYEPYLSLVTHGALKASPSEIESNPRSASVRLRAAEKLRQKRKN
ncbi:MAG: 16S rRNA (cytosine(1402)-N(4))-methyltransferase RsmH [Ancrocorticia sp.]|nr:16S rRNA (cytosine(1402)-N(4))-methyltransferase RsmH [Ancrocorticia sp.]